MDNGVEWQMGVGELTWEYYNTKATCVGRRHPTHELLTGIHICYPILSTCTLFDLSALPYVWSVLHMLYHPEQSKTDAQSMFCSLHLLGLGMVCGLITGTKVVPNRSQRVVHV